MTPEQFELLIRMSEKQDLMYNMFTNHLQHHFLYTIALFTAVLGLGGITIKLLWARSKQARSNH